MIAAAQLVTVILRLAAACEPGAAEPSALDVSLTVPVAGRPVFRLDDSVYGTAGMAQLVSGAEASDRRGPLPLLRRDTADALELAGTRAAVGAVTLRYRARSVAVADAGARHGLRHDATGVGGLGAFFLVLPESRRSHRLRVEWGPPACGAGQGISSFGFDPGPAEATGRLDSLRMAAYFFGRPQRFTNDVDGTRVEAAWFGAPALDAAAASAAAARAFAAERSFFADDDPAPYRVFVRVLPEMDDRSNGMGQPGSLLLAIGPRTPLGPRLAVNIAHEMWHRWLGLQLRLAGPDGTRFWFTEGFTVYYASLVLLRAGLLSPDDFLGELNRIATRHFTNPRAAASNDEIRRGFFTDEALSTVPYTRGALYAAELDAAIRRASGGARSLDTLMRGLHRAARAAPVGAAGLRELPPSAFRRAVQRELGRAGVDRFDAVIERGAPPDPPADGYGPCFARVARDAGFAWERVTGVPDDRCAAAPPG